jgi:uncharacterized membrane protein HdeD (DUF308 family)
MANVQWTATDTEVRNLATNWWAVALRGGLAILFGLMTFAVPALTLASLIWLFGAYAIIEGAVNLFAAARGHGQRPWWVLVIEGAASIGAGVVTFALPGLTALVLLYVIAARAIVTGALEILAAIRLRARIAHEWWLGLSGALSIAFGVLLMAAPVAGALAVVLWIGAYAVVFGALLVGLAFRLRAHREAPPASVRLAA